jgi:hypothetical protein
MKLSATEQDIDGDAELFLIAGQPVRRKPVEKYLGSRFTSEYDRGQLNIKQRIAAARRKLNVQMGPIMENRTARIELKLAFYVSDVVPLLLHGVEYWLMTPQTIQQLDNFQRKSILQIAGRTYKDHITNMDIYEWLHEKKCRLYPMEIVMAERKTKYFSRIVREGITREDLASRMYWSDVPHPCSNWGEFEYEHVQHLKKAIKCLGITEIEANQEFRDAKKWEKNVLDHKHGEAYTRWRVVQHRKQEERQRKMRCRAAQEETIEEEEYTRRPLP